MIKDYVLGIIASFIFWIGATAPFVFITGIDITSEQVKSYLLVSLSGINIAFLITIAVAFLVSFAYSNLVNLRKT